MFSSEKGFTLIELLIVVAIITVIAAAVIITVTPGERLTESRDATRAAHLTAIGTSVHMAVVDARTTCGSGNDELCDSVATVLDGCVTVVNTTTTIFGASCATAVGLAEAPTDPQSGQLYLATTTGSNPVRVVVWTTSTEGNYGPAQANGRTF